MAGMTVTTEIGTAPLADLIKQVQAGNEVLLTQGNKPVAKLVPAVEKTSNKVSPLDIPSITGHQVLAPKISQSEIADEIFARK